MQKHERDNGFSSLERNTETQNIEIHKCRNAKIQKYRKTKIHKVSVRRCMGTKASKGQ